MLILQTGNCEKCQVNFGPLDTVQSTNVECSKCRKNKIVCSKCKYSGCECGGRFLDALDKNPGKLF